MLNSVFMLRHNPSHKRPKKSLLANTLLKIKKFDTFKILTTFAITKARKKIARTENGNVW